MIKAGDDGKCEPEQMLVPLPDWVAAKVFSKWAYDGNSGPYKWKHGYPECDGKKQSPINIVRDSASVQNGPKDSIGTFGKYPDMATFTIKQSHGAPVYSCKGDCGSFKYKGKKYSVLQFHCHAKSENTIDGVAYPMECHFVHATADMDLLVVGIMLSLDGEASKDGYEGRHAALTKEAVSGANDESEIKIPIGSWIDTKAGFYHWEGSLTTPPCSEGVMWFLQKTVRYISEEDCDTYNGHIGGFPGNARPTMPLHGRIVMSSTP